MHFALPLHFIRNIRAKFGILNSSQSPDIGQNLDGCISNFRISGQSLTKETCHNSGTSDNIDMKLGPVTKLDKRKKTTSKKIGDDIMSENYDVIVIFLIYGQFGAIRKPNSLPNLYYFCQIMLIFLEKNAGISKIKRALVLKGIFSETKYVCILMCLIWSF